MAQHHFISMFSAFVILPMILALRRLLLVSQRFDSSFWKISSLQRRHGILPELCIPGHVLSAQSSATFSGLVIVIHRIF
jgi:hypothetical protein